MSSIGTGRYYAQATNSVKAYHFTTLRAAAEMARALSKEDEDRTAAVYRDDGTGFDPLLERFKNGRKVFSQRKYV